MIGTTKKREKREFNYQPRFYNKTDEDIKKQKILNSENTNVDFADRFHQKINEKRTSKKASNRKLLIMLAILFMLLYILLH